MRLNRNMVILIFMLVGIFVIWRVNQYSHESTLEDIRLAGNARVELYATTLKKELDSYRSLPYILARDHRVKLLLEERGNPFDVNQHLEDYAVNSKASALFILNGEGTTIASSNWRTSESFVGHNFSYRPYFQDALKGKQGNYYAVGVQTRKPGFYMSNPVYREGELLGVVVVKVDLSKLERQWTELGENVAVSDAYGVYILSSISQWRYRTIRPLSDITKDRLKEIQYLDQDLEEAPMKRSSSDLGTQVKYKNINYLEQSIQMPDLVWRIHYLSDLRPLHQSVNRNTLLAGAGWIVLAFILLFLRERRQKIQSRKEAEDAQIIRKTNERLEAEIQVRRETEEHLRKTQAELVQAEKLAALGRMSAAIAHELNQPISAIRTFGASAKKFLERSSFEDVAKNLDMVNQLTERMEAITSQLKTFARKNPEKLTDIDVKQSLERVLTFLKAGLDKDKIIIEKGFIELPVLVRADQVRLEQVFTNLIRNAADAMKDVEDKRLLILVTETDDQIEITIKDKGPGIEEDDLNKIFDPFFTTKEVGAGLGLGLYISYGIISDLGGQLKASNRQNQGGASFTITFNKD